MFEKRLIISLFLILIAVSLLAQKEDSKLPNLILNEDSIDFSEENINLIDNSELKNVTDRTNIIDYFLDKGNTYIRSEKIDSLHLTVQHLTHLIQENPRNNELLYSYYYLSAKYHGIKTDFISELDYWLKLKSILESSQVDDLIMVNQAIAIIYYRLLDFESSLKLYKDNLDVIEKTDDHIGLLYTYFGLADCYLQLGRYVDAKEICFKSISLKRKTGASSAFGFIYSLLGYIYLTEAQIDSAEYYLNKGIAISQEQHEPKELYDNYNVMVELQLLKGDTLLAQSYAEKSIGNTLFHEPKLYNNLAKIYSHQNKHLKANKLLEKNIKFYEDINNNNPAFSLASSLLESRFEEKQSKEIAKNQRKINLIIIIALILLLLLSSIIISNQIFHKRKFQKMNHGLIEKNEYLEHFAYICSHDLKEPIRNIGSFASLIQNKLKKEDLKLDYDEYFQIINGGTAMLSQTVDSLKIFTNLNQHEAFEKSKISLVSMINNTIQSLHHLIDKNDVIISINNEITHQEIYSFKYGINLILFNIIQNAIKFNPSKNKTVDISIKNRNDDILIIIEDNGPGIPKEYSKQIFLPFKTLQNKVITKSSGLGLAICVKVINIIGGKIWLESELGKGSKFHILIKQ